MDKSLTDLTRHGLMTSEIDSYRAYSFSLYLNFLSISLKGACLTAVGSNL